MEKCSAMIYHQGDILFICQLDKGHLGCHSSYNNTDDASYWINWKENHLELESFTTGRCYSEGETI